MNDYIERKILIGLIANDQFLKSFSRDFSPENLTTDTSRMVATWCLDYYEQYRRAPGRRDFATLYATKTPDLDKTESEDLSDLLSGLSRDSEKWDANADFLLEETRTHIESQSIIALSERLQKALLRNNGNSVNKEALEEAREEIEKFRLKNLPSKDSSLVDPLDGISAVRRAFVDRPEPLIPFARALGQFWNDQMYRSALIGFLAPEKRGKSWLLMECAILGLRNGSNVAVFQAGDMSEAQQLVRMYMRISGRPAPLRLPWKEAEEDELEGEPRSGKQVFWVPSLDCAKNLCGTCPYNDTLREDSKASALFSPDEWEDAKEDGTLAEAMKERMIQRRERWQPCIACKDAFDPAVSLHLKEVDRALDVRNAYKAVTRWRKQYKGKMRLATYVNETLSVSEINRQLEEWESEGTKADVVIIDYADLLAPDKDYQRMEWRQQINKTWQRLRALSEKRNCLVITATQAAASSYDKSLLRLSDFSEDKRKYAHCTAMYGLNQLSDEKKFGILRINQLVVREGDFNTQNQVRILQCLSVGKPILASY